MSTALSNRIGFIDQCKGIGIILMVYGHCITDDFLHRNPGVEFFSLWFNSFHMPLFFIIGGLLIAYKQESFAFPKTVIKKAKQLLLPGLYFSSLSILMHAFTKLIAKENAIQYLKDRALELLTLQLPDAMWFLPCYFFAEILFLLLIKKLLFKLQVPLICLGSFIISVFLKYLCEIAFINRLSRLFMAICFISIGYMLFQYILSNQYRKDGQNRLDSIRLRVLLFAGGMILIAFGIVGTYFNGGVGCLSASYGRNPILFLFDAIVGTVGIMLIFLTIGKRMIPLEFFGKNSLIVLCTHMHIISVFWLLNGHLFHIGLVSINAGLFTMGILLFDIPVILVVNRFLPFLIGRHRR